MNRIINVLFVLLIAIPIDSKSQTTTTIKIYFVDLNTETPFRIECDNFKSFFKTDIDSIIVHNRIKIRAIVREINKLSLANDSLYTLKSFPDTRVNLKLVHRNHTITNLCIDRFTVYKNGQLFVLSDSLKSLITEEVSLYIKKFKKHLYRYNTVDKKH
jgi:hypothetical protein